MIAIFLRLISFFDCHSAGIQAICAILALCGLAIYTWLTYGIRKITTTQFIAAQRPLIVFETDKAGDFYIENKGCGPALNVTWKVGQEDDTKFEWYALGAIAVRDWSDLVSPVAPELVALPDQGVRIHYSDLAGNFYYTNIFTKDGAIQQDNGTLAK